MLAEASKPGLTWPEILSHTHIIEADFQAIYGLDVAEFQDTKTFRWFVVRVEGLLARPSGLLNKLQQQQRNNNESSEDGGDR